MAEAFIKFYCKTLYNKNKTSELAGDSRCNTGIRNVTCLRKVIRGRNKGGYPRGQQVTQRHRTDKGHFISKNNAP